MKNANITDSNRIFQVKEADATEASRVRPANKRTVGAIISNELLDEFDPVLFIIRLRVVFPRIPSSHKSYHVLSVVVHVLLGEVVCPADNVGLQVVLVIASCKVATT